MTTAPLDRPPLLQSPTAILPRLSIMMFLQFAIQGAWLPLVFTYLNKHRGIPEGQVGTILAAGAFGAVLSPFLAGQLADRYMNAERFLAAGHFLGAAVVWLIADLTNTNALLALSFLYGVFYTPTLAVCNAIAFTHLPDRDRDFGKVRVFGTIGWVCVGIGIGQWLLFKAGHDRPAQLAGMQDAFRISALLGILQGLYAFTLPKTPPKRGTQKYAPGEALMEIRRQPLITIFLISIPIAAAHSFFFARTADFLGELDLKAPWADKIFGVGGAGLMTIGQISEMLFLALMPLIIPRVKRKTILTIGLLAYTARFAIFAYLPHAWALIPGLALHGPVFACFFFVCFMVIDEYTTKDVRASAQNLFNLIVFGLGVIFGNILAGRLAQWTRVNGQMNWQAYYAIPMWITIICLVAFLIFYPNRPRVRQEEASLVH